MSSKDLRHKAWQQLRISYWSALVASIIVMALSAASAPLVFIIVGPLLVGQAYYLLDLAENKSKVNNFELFFEPFKKSLVTSIVTNILKGIFIFLWALLLVIPGIIKSYAYSMTSYIIADNPQIDFMEAIKESQNLMKGNKWRLFKLHFSFIGWYILGVLTLGLGFIFLYPYIQLSVANFYVEIRGNKPLQSLT